MKKIVFLNGNFMPQEEAKISVLSPGFLYGWGLFETMRAYKSRIVYFKQHLKRISSSAGLISLRLPYSLAQLKEVILRVIKINGFLDSYVKLLVSKSKSGVDILVIVEPYKPYLKQKYKQGLRACVSSFKQNEHSHLARIKTTNYLFYQLAYLQAQRRGFEEAIILNQRGYLCEASRSNLFFVREKELFTPDLECGCLDGITRSVVFDIARKARMKIHTGRFTLADLCAAEEAFLTNSLMGLMPLSSVENRFIGKGKIRKSISDFLMRKYTSLLKNGI